MTDQIIETENGSDKRTLRQVVKDYCAAEDQVRIYRYFYKHADKHLSFPLGVTADENNEYSISDLEAPYRVALNKEAFKERVRELEVLRNIHGKVIKTFLNYYKTSFSYTHDKPQGVPPYEPRVAYFKFSLDESYNLKVVATYEPDNYGLAEEI